MWRDWSFFLEDILEACDLILEFTEGLTLEEFEENRQVFHAVTRNLEITGEAAKRIPEEVRQCMPEVDWSGAAKFRDVIAHQYFRLDPAIIWNIVRTKIPVMRQAVHRHWTERHGHFPSPQDAP